MKSSRRGSLMLETMMAVTLVAIALAGVSQLLLLASRQQRIVESRRLAQREAGNVMERVMIRRDGELTADKLAEITVSPETRASLPSATLNIRVTPTEEATTSMIRVEVGWVERTGQAQQVEISAWRQAGSIP
jgi:type II secretory pathway pseudopilin PulG